MNLDFAAPGLDKMRARILAIALTNKQAFAAATYLASSLIMSSSQRKVPTDTGYLKKSAYITKPNIGDHFSFHAGYSAPYAAYVHEDTRAEHEVGESHFLLKAMMERRNGFASDVARYMKSFGDSGKTIDEVDTGFPQSPPSSSSVFGPNQTGKNRKRRLGQVARMNARGPTESGKRAAKNAQAALAEAYSSLWGNS